MPWQFQITITGSCPQNKKWFCIICEHWVIWEISQLICLTVVYMQTWISHHIPAMQGSSHQCIAQRSLHCILTHLCISFNLCYDLFVIKLLALAPKWFGPNIKLNLKETHRINKQWLKITDSNIDSNTSLPLSTMITTKVEWTYNSYKQRNTKPALIPPSSPPSVLASSPSPMPPHIRPTK